MKFSKRFPAIIAIAIPATFIAAIALAVYLPVRHSHVERSFAYTLIETEYVPLQGWPAPSGVAYSRPPNQTVSYHIYDAPLKQSRSISQSEFNELDFLENELPQQTIVFENGYYSSDPFTETFGSGGNGPGVYVEGENSKKKLFNLNDYDTQFEFAGWLK